MVQLNINMEPWRTALVFYTVDKVDEVAVLQPVLFGEKRYHSSNGCIISFDCFVAQDVSSTGNSPAARNRREGGSMYTSERLRVKYVKGLHRHQGSV